MSGENGAAGRPACDPAALLLRLEVEEFLYHEAALLDGWQLDEWVALFTEDARYVVPTTDLPDGDPERDLVLIDDDLARLRGRATRLLSRHAHREFPWSRTRRLVANVRLTRVTPNELDVSANVVVYRVRGEMAPFVGRCRYTLVRTPDGFRIRSRRTELDHEELRDHGSVSIIV